MHSTDSEVCQNNIYNTVPLTAPLSYYWAVTENGERKVHAQWIEWAKQLLQVGYSSKQIKELSATTTVENQFKLIGLINVIWDQLHIDLKDLEAVIKNYGIYIVRQGLINDENPYSVLQQLEKLFLDTELYLLYDFHILYHAYKELKKEGEQYYWQGITFQNKEEYIKQYFKEWLKFPKSQICMEWESKSSFRKCMESIFYRNYLYILLFISASVLISLLAGLIYSIYSANFFLIILTLSSLLTFIVSIINRIK